MPTTVIFNGACPICSREVAVYQRKAEAKAAPIAFEDLNAVDLDRFGLSADDAARVLHVVEEGRLLRGVDAFLALWRHTPGFGWLARLVGLPGLRQVAGFVYERGLAPRLYARHLRRMQKAD